MEPNARLAPGQVVASRYQIGRFLGRGEMGEVYEARDSQTGRAFAFKLLLREIGRGAEHVLLFRQEAQRLAALAGDVLCRVYDVQPDAETRAPYVLEDMIDLPSLAQVITSQGPLPVAAVEAIIGKLATGLEAAHHASVVHRGLKPTNIFAAPGPQGWSVKITDFGMAGMRVAVPDPLVSLIQPTIPPEQAQGAPAAPTMDGWSLGVLAFFALTGCYPFLAVTRAPGDTNQLWAELTAPFPSASQRARELSAEIPASLDPWFTKALAPNPAERFPNVRELAAAFSQAVATPAEGSQQRTFKGTLVMDQKSPLASGAAFEAARAQLAAQHAAQAAAPPQGVPVAQGMAPAQQTIDPSADAPPKKKSPVLLIVGILGVLVVLGIVLTVVLVVLRKPSSPPPTETTATTKSPDNTAATASSEAAAPAAAASDAPAGSDSAAPAGSAAPASDVLVTFACDPDCDEVDCDGAKIDNTVGVRLMPGKHVCVGKKDGYSDKSDSFTVKLGADVKRPLALKKKADPVAATPGPATGTPPPAHPKNQKCGTFINPCK